MVTWRLQRGHLEGPGYAQLSFTFHVFAPQLGPKHDLLFDRKRPCMLGGGWSKLEIAQGLPF